MNTIVFRRLSAALFITLAVFIALTFRQHGISNDEEVQHIYGRLLLDFYTSGFTDQAAFHYKNLYLYGGFFDLIAAVIERISGMAYESVSVWDMRHFLSALFGFFGIVAAYKISRLLGGERAGFIAITLLAITGTWSGAMFTHTKDIPFATCMAWALYYIMLISQQLPKPSLKLTLRLGIAVGCALGMRIGGVFTVFYLLLAMGLGGLFAAHTLRARLNYWICSVKYLVPAGIVACLLMAIFWPWGVMSPGHPLLAAKSFSHFSFDMLTVMDGKVMKVGDAPRYYLLAYLLVRLPEVFLIGLLSMLVVAIKQLCQIKVGLTTLLWFTLVVAAMFPLVFILLDKPALYNGIRHFTFILPPLAVLAALGLSAMLDMLTVSPKLRIGFIVICVALTINTAFTFVRLHPYQYVYYNLFAGDLTHAEHAWEGDYWSSSLKEAAQMLSAKITSEATSHKKINDDLNRAPYRVAVCAESVQADVYLDERFQITSDWVNADFFISSTNMNCDKVMQGRIIGTVNRLGATLAVIKDRRDLLQHERMPHPAPN